MSERLGTSASILALPAAGASVRGLGDSFQADLCTGSGAFDIPIPLPPATAGFAPGLVLRHASGAGAGPFGQGWQLSLPRIQRQTQSGLPTYDDEVDTFGYSGQDLVPVGDGFFRPRVDTQGMRIRRLGDAWEVTDKAGVRSLFGQSPGSRIEDPATGRRFAWLLDEITTPTGQSARFSYLEDGVARQLISIAYGPFKVILTYEPAARPRIERRAAFTVKESLRCREIAVESERAVRPVLRRYELSYAADASTQGDLLSAVRLMAGDGAAQIAMPEIRLDYSRSGPAAARIVDIAAADPLPPLGAMDVDLVDLAGDGRPGLIRGSAAGWFYWPNLGEGRFGPARALDGVPSRLTLDQPNVQFADLEGNGTADLLWGEAGRQGYYPNAAGGAWEVFQPYSTDLPFSLTDPRFRLYDTDGDGRIDGVFSGPDAFLTFFNLGQMGWSSEAIRTPRIRDQTLFPDVTFEDPHILTADMNGGGLTDIVEIRDGRICYWPYLDRGTWGARVEMANAPVIGPQFDPTQFRLIDVDGDGAADLVLLEADGARLWLNEGGLRFGEPVTFPFPGLSSFDVVIVDLLAEGRPGLLVAGPDPATGHHRYRFISFGPAHNSGFLTEISTGLGHSTRIIYGLSNEHRQRDEASATPWKSFLPFPVVVVDAIELEDRPTGIKTTTVFAYRDGHYDGLERAFNGFGEVRRTVHGGPGVPVLATRAVFHAGTALELSEAERRVMDPVQRLKLRSLKGSPLLFEEYDESASSGRAFSRIENTYDARIDHEAGSRRVVAPYGVIAQTDDLGESTTRRTLIIRAAPDAHLNPVQIDYASGVVDAAGDFTETTWRIERCRYVVPAGPDATFWAPGLTCEETLSTPDGDVLQCVRTYYDGAPFTGLALGQASRGAVARIEELVCAASTDAAVEAGLRASGHHFLMANAAELAPSGWYRNRIRYRITTEGVPSALMDALGATAGVEYDAWGIDPVRVMDAEGLMTTATYDRQVEQVASVTGPDGVTESRTYDSLGRTIATSRTTASGDVALLSATVHDPGLPGARPPCMTTVYADSPGFDLQTLLALARAPETAAGMAVVRKAYGACGLELESISTAPRTVTGALYVRTGRRVYDGRGRLRLEEAPALSASLTPLLRLPRSGGPTYERTFDAVGRETRLTFPLGERHHSFTPFETFITDANAVNAGEGPSFVRVFDAEGRQIRTNARIESGADAECEFRYAPEGWLAGVTDPSADEIVTVGRDRLGRIVEAQHRDCGVYRYRYDARGALIGVDHPVGGTTRYEYDKLQRLTRVQEFGADGLPVTSRALYFDQAPDGGAHAPGRLCAIDDEAGRTTFLYNVRGELVGKHRRLPDGRVLSLGFEYDHLGRVVAIVYPEGTRVAYRYGAAGELAAIEGFIDDAAYDARGRPERIRYANGIETVISYDAAERIAAVRSTRGGVELATFGCVYDPGGNLVKLTASIDGAPDEARHLAYDRLNRLVRSSGTRGSEAFDHAFAYDAAGNLLQITEHGLAELDYGDTARPGLLTGLTWTDGRVEQRVYDAAGRLVVSGRFKNVTYDLANRMRSAVFHACGGMELTYDHFGRRALTVTVGTDGSRMASWSFDGLYEERAGERILHVRGIGGLIASVHLQPTGKSQARFQHTDAQGNVRFTANAAGQILSRHAYTSFGLEIEPRPEGRFAGKLPDPDLQLIQLGSRFYEPLTGRFTTPDLLLFERPEAGLADPVVFNVYAYAINNPHRFHDPSGRFPWAIVIGVVIGAVIGYNTAKENGSDPFVGAVLGGLVGGLVGWAGLLKPALIGTAMGAFGSAQAGEKVWTGAAVGFVFGAIGGAVGEWLPSAGDGSWTKLSAGLVEVVADGLVAGAAAGVQARLNNKSFEDGFRSGFVLGASVSALKVTMLGARTNPASMNKNLDSSLKQEWARQGRADTHNYLSSEVGAAGMPNTSQVTFRSGGLIHHLTGGRSFVLAGSVQMGLDTTADLQSGSASVLAHELRHIAQQDAATFGFAEFVIVWLFQSATNNAQYQHGPANTTLETAY